MAAAILGGKMDYKLQSVLFSSEVFTEAKAKAWLKRHKIEAIKEPHSTARFYRFRIMEPIDTAEFFTIPAGDDIKLTFMRVGIVPNGTASPPHPL
jgi:hypothetical protein